MVTLQNISVQYGDEVIIDHVNADYGAGASHALIGRNGSGKSTLLRVMSGLLTPKSGNVEIDGVTLGQLSRQKFGKLVSLVSTERIRIPKFTCREIVALGRAPYTDWIGNLSKDDWMIVDKALALVGMKDFSSRQMSNMSDGECQRVMIARAIAQDTPVILLDEPTSFLDLPNRYELCGLLSRLAHEEGKCIIYSSHELDIVLKSADTVTLIDNKKLTHLPVEEMRESMLIQEVFGITL